MSVDTLCYLSLLCKLVLAVNLLPLIVKQICILRRKTYMFFSLKTHQYELKLNG